MCNEFFIEKDIQVRYHCHVSGNYGYFARKRYNITFRFTNKMFVVFYNLIGFDGQFIMTKNPSFIVNINVIPNNIERYMAFKKIFKNGVYWQYGIYKLRFRNIG